MIIVEVSDLGESSIRLIQSSYKVHFGHLFSVILTSFDYPNLGMTFGISFWYAASVSQPFRGRQAHANGVEVKFKNLKNITNVYPKVFINLIFSENLTGTRSEQKQLHQKVFKTLAEHPTLFPGAKVNSRQQD